MDLQFSCSDHELNSFILWRQRRQGQSYQNAYQNAELLYAFQRLSPHNDIRFRDYDWRSVTQDPRQRCSRQVVSTDLETSLYRFWLLGRENGQLSIYDAEAPYRALQRFCDERNRPRQYPLGYVPTEDDRREERRLLRERRPLVFPYMTADLFPRASNAKVMTCCKWLPRETEGVIASFVEGVVAVWDLQQITKPLFQIHSSEAPVCSLVSDGEYTNNAAATDGVRRGLSYAARRQLIACCSQTMLRLLDLRVGAFVSSLRDSKASFCAAWHPLKSDILVSGGTDGLLRCWDIRMAGGECVFHFDLSQRDSSFHHDSVEPKSRVTKLASALAANRLKRLSQVAVKPPTASTTLDRVCPSQTSEGVQMHHTMGFTTEQAMWDFVRQAPDACKRQRSSTVTELPGSKKMLRGGGGASRVRAHASLSRRTTTPVTSNVMKPFTQPQTMSRPQAHAHCLPITGLTFVQGGAFLVSNTLGTWDVHRAYAAHDHVRLWNADTGKRCPVVYDIPSHIARAPTMDEMLLATRGRRRQATNHNHSPVSPPLTTARCEVLRTASGPEYLLSGMGARLAIHDVLTGQLIAAPRAFHSSDRITSVLCIGKASPVASGMGLLLTVDTCGSLCAWNIDDTPGVGSVDGSIDDSSSTSSDPEVPFSVQLLARRVRRQRR